MTGCSKNEGTFEDDKLNIVTTIFPEYDWVKEILGENANHAELLMLLDNGVDLHSYQPTADDMIKISSCDLFIYVGGESDEWVEDALKEAVNPDMVVINLLEELGDNVKTEELVEGMEPELDSEEEEHNDKEDDNEGKEQEEEADEHVWLSLNNAELLCKVIADKLSELDPDHKADYSSNMNAYINKLDTLDMEYKNMVDSSAKDSILFGDRFPFRYLADDYGLNYYAAFVGCSAETEASFETITFLAGKVDELGLSGVLTIEGAKHKIAETIISNTQNKDQRLLTMDSMQSVTSTDVENGATYLAIMEGNLEVLKGALN
jgi:zinc transport system substrate-binding protein